MISADLILQPRANVEDAQAIQLPLDSAIVIIARRSGYSFSNA
jgi:hypothetical protein